MGFDYSKPRRPKHRTAQLFGRRTVAGPRVNRRGGSPLGGVTFTRSLCQWTGVPHKLFIGLRNKRCCSVVFLFVNAGQSTLQNAIGRICIASFKRTLALLFLSIGLTATISAAADYAIANVTVINPGRGEPRRDMTIVVHEDAIVAVLPSKQFRAKPFVEVIEERGKFVIPGLWDMHVHFRDASRDLKMDIANGVLGIRNMGGAPKDIRMAWGSSPEPTSRFLLRIPALVCTMNWDC